MLKIKSLLLACSVAFPSLLIAIQPPAQAQIRGISGLGVGAASGARVNFHPETGPATAPRFRTFDVSASLVLFLQSLNGVFSETGDPIQVGSVLGGTASRVSVENGLADPNAGNVRASPTGFVSRTVIKIVRLDGTSETVEFFTPYPNPATATLAEKRATEAKRQKAEDVAIEMLKAGGNDVAVKLASRLGFAGVTSKDAVEFVTDVSKLLASVNVKTASSLINSNMASLSSQFVVSSLRTKSFDSSKSFVISQQRKEPESGSSVTLSVPSLVKTIESYNKMIDNADAKTVENISMDKRLGKINESLKSLRGLFVE